MKVALGVVALVASSAVADPLLDKQLGGLDDARATFAADAFSVLPELPVVGALPKLQSDGFMQNNDVILQALQPGRVTTGTRGNATWIVAEASGKFGLLDCPPHLAKCNPTRTLRISELVIGGKVVAAHVDDPQHEAGGLETKPMAPETEAGPLTALIANPRALAAALADDPAVVVLGTELAERAVGAVAAKKLLGSWSSLTLKVVGKPHEVRAAGWGYAAANVDWVAKGRTVNMRATVFAVPKGSGWQVIAVHYSVPHHRS